VGMRQCDLASAMAFASRDENPGLSESAIGSGRLDVRIDPRKAAALAELLPDFAIEPHHDAAKGNGLSGVAAWSGSRHQGRARKRAEARGVPFLVLGCGLLRAPPRWGRASPLLSMTAHTMSGPSSPADILYPSRLLSSRAWETPALLARAAGARRDMVSRRLGGAWWNPAADRELPRGDGLSLIVVDEGGVGAAESSPSPPLLRAMLAAALVENETSKVVVLAPDQRRFRGTLKDAASRGCVVLTRPVDPWKAIERADHVYAAGSEIGFLALLADRKVRCFADSFYSGWGVTTDDPTLPHKPFRRTLDEVFAGACLAATRYLDPYRKKPTSFKDILEILDDWRKIETANRRIAVCVGMSFWKRRRVADFLRSSTGRPAFRRTTRGALAKAHATSGSTVAVWASRAPAGLAEAAGRQRIPLIRVEDGFVRSVGLGSDFMPAASLVLDSRGMHFDPSVRSDLELLLSEAEFDAALVERARRLITQLVARGVTKYNLGKRALLVESPPGRRRVLVPGQVEDDLSVRLGGEGIIGNLELLGRVRAANPDAFILYKPHPDVEAGHRRGRIPDGFARKFADIVIREVSTATVLAEIDELHTLTSLAGFEALLRRRRVVVYGRPFYAGWGLTTDLARIDRGRRLALEELVAGALILYPRYLDPVTRLPCGPEIVIERLDNAELWRPGPLVLARRLQGVLSRRWGRLAGEMPKLPSGRSPASDRDDFGTPAV